MAATIGTTTIRGTVGARVVQVPAAIGGVATTQMVGAQAIGGPAVLTMVGGHEVSHWRFGQPLAAALPSCDEQ